MMDTVIDSEHEQVASKAGKRRRQKPLIGIDPLQWINEEQSVTSEGETEAEAISSMEVGDHEEDNSDSNEAADLNKELKDQEMEVREIDMENHAEENMDESNGTIVLQGPVTVADVSQFYEEVKNLLSEKKSIEVECAELESIDAAALQLFVAISHEAANHDLKINWKEPPEVFTQAVQLMGLEAEL